MVRTMQRSPQWTIDPKRVAAWAGVFILHLWVLAAMLLPREALLPTPRLSPPEVTVIVDPPRPPPLPPPPPLPVPPPPVTLQPFTPPPAALPTPAPAPATTSSEFVVDTPTEQTVLPQTGFDTGSTTDAGNAQPALLTLATKYAPPPAYPRRELARGIEGTVDLRVLVDANGLPTTIERIGGSGNRNLEMAAIRALKRWRFQPHTVNGAPQAAWARVPFVFHLDP